MRRKAPTQHHAGQRQGEQGQGTSQEPVPAETAAPQQTQHAWANGAVSLMLRLLQGKLLAMGGSAGPPAHGTDPPMQQQEQHGHTVCHSNTAPPPSDGSPMEHQPTASNAVNASGAVTATGAVRQGPALSPAAAALKPSWAARHLDQASIQQQQQQLQGEEQCRAQQQARPNGGAHPSLPAPPPPSPQRPCKQAAHESMHTEQHNASTVATAVPIAPRWRSQAGGLPQPAPMSEPSLNRPAAAVHADAADTAVPEQAGSCRGARPGSAAGASARATSVAQGRRMSLVQRLADKAAEPPSPEPGFVTPTSPPAAASTHPAPVSAHQAAAAGLSAGTGTAIGAGAGAGARPGLNGSNAPQVQQLSERVTKGSSLSNLLDSTRQSALPLSAALPGAALAGPLQQQAGCEPPERRRQPLGWMGFKGLFKLGSHLAAVTAAVAPGPQPGTRREEQLRQVGQVAAELGKRQDQQLDEQEMQQQGEVQQQREVQQEEDAQQQHGQQLPGLQHGQQHQQHQGPVPPPQPSQQQHQQRASPTRGGRREGAARGLTPAQQLLINLQEQYKEQLQHPQYDQGQQTLGQQQGRSPGLAHKPRPSFAASPAGETAPTQRPQPSASRSIQRPTAAATAAARFPAVRATRSALAGGGFLPSKPSMNRLTLSRPQQAALAKFEPGPVVGSRLRAVRYGGSQGGAQRAVGRDLEPSRTRVAAGTAILRGAGGRGCLPEGRVRVQQQQQQQGEDDVEEEGGEEGGCVSTEEEEEGLVSQDELEGERQQLEGQGGAAQQDIHLQQQLCEPLVAESPCQQLDQRQSSGDACGPLPPGPSLSCFNIRAFGATVPWTSASLQPDLPRGGRKRSGSSRSRAIRHAAARATGRSLYAVRGSAMSLKAVSRPKPACKPGVARSAPGQRQRRRQGASGTPTGTTSAALTAAAAATGVADMPAVAAEAAVAVAAVGYKVLQRRLAGHGCQVLQKPKSRQRARAVAQQARAAGVGKPRLVRPSLPDLKGASVAKRSPAAGAAAVGSMSPAAKRPAAAKPSAQRKASRPAKAQEVAEPLPVQKSAAVSEPTALSKPAAMGNLAAVLKPTAHAKPVAVLKPVAVRKPVAVAHASPTAKSVAATRGRPAARAEPAPPQSPSRATAVIKAATVKARAVVKAPSAPRAAPVAKLSGCAKPQETVARSLPAAKAPAVVKAPLPVKTSAAAKERPTAKAQAAAEAPPVPKAVAIAKAPPAAEPGARRAQLKPGASARALSRGLPAEKPLAGAATPVRVSASAAVKAAVQRVRVRPRGAAVAGDLAAADKGPAAPKAAITATAPAAVWEGGPAFAGQRPVQPRAALALKASDGATQPQLSQQPAARQHARAVVKAPANTALVSGVEKAGTACMRAARKTPLAEQLQGKTLPSRGALKRLRSSQQQPALEAAAAAAAITAARRTRRSTETGTAGPGPVCNSPAALTTAEPAAPASRAETPAMPAAAADAGREGRLAPAATSRHRRGMSVDVDLLAARGNQTARVNAQAAAATAAGTEASLQFKVVRPSQCASGHKQSAEGGLASVAERKRRREAVSLPEAPLPSSQQKGHPDSQLPRRIRSTPLDCPQRQEGQGQRERQKGSEQQEQQEQPQRRGGQQYAQGHRQEQGRQLQQRRQQYQQQTQQPGQLQERQRGQRPAQAQGRGKTLGQQQLQQGSGQQQCARAPSSQCSPVGGAGRQPRASALQARQLSASYAAFVSAGDREIEAVEAAAVEAAARARLSPVPRSRVPAAVQVRPSRQKQTAALSARSLLASYAAYLASGHGAAPPSSSGHKLGSPTAAVDLAVASSAAGKVAVKKRRQAGEADAAAPLPKRQRRQGGR